MTDVVWELLPPCGSCGRCLENSQREWRRAHLDAMYVERARVLDWHLPTFWRRLEELVAERGVRRAELGEDGHCERAQAIPTI